MRHTLSLLLCATLTAALSAQGAIPFNDSIRASELRADLYFLAGDGFQGRLVGTPENALAAEFVRSALRARGAETWSAQRVVRADHEPDDRHPWREEPADMVFLGG